MTATNPQRKAVDRRVDALVNDVIGRVADNWTMIVTKVLIA